jgi:Ras-related protein Rab-39B
LLEAKRHIEPYRPVFALVGCKLDLVKNGENREVSVEEAKTFAEQHELIYVETSARTGINVRESFALVTQEIHSRIKSGEYKVESGWEGIKTGELTDIDSMNSTIFSPSGFPRPSSLDFNLVMAEPAKSSCC